MNDCPGCFTCAHCGDHFVSATAPGEAETEYIENFGKQPTVEDAARVCDECYHLLMALHYPGRN
jgi:hypothetical protein